MYIRRPQNSWDESGWVEHVYAKYFGQDSVRQGKVHAIVMLGPIFPKVNITGFWFQRSQGISRGLQGLLKFVIWLSCMSMNSLGEILCPFLPLRTCISLIKSIPELCWSGNPVTDNTSTLGWINRQMILGTCSVPLISFPLDGMIPGDLIILTAEWMHKNTRQSKKRAAAYRKCSCVKAFIKRRFLKTIFW